MSDVRLAVIYYSSTGTNHEMAREAASAAEEAGATVRFRRVAETAPQEAIEADEDWKAHLEETRDVPVASPDDMEWANAYLFSSPTRYGNATSQIRAFIDTLGPLWFEGKLADKPVTALTSAMNPHGGQETTLQSLYYTFMHWGAVIVPPGYTDQAIFESGGNPYGASVSVGGDGLTDATRKAVRHQARRLVGFAEKLG